MVDAPDDDWFHIAVLRRLEANLFSFIQYMLFYLNVW